MKNNLLIRSITGLLFVLVLVGAIYAGPYTFALVFILTIALAIKEFSHLIKEVKSIQIHLPLNILCGILLFVAIWSYRADFTGAVAFAPYIMALIGLFLLELYRKSKNPIDNWAYSFFGQIYIALPFSLLSYLGFQERGSEYSPIFPLFIFVFIWLNDSGAYLIGCNFGKRKLFPRISPKKSWEGFYGGVITAIIGSYIASLFFPILSTIEWIGLGAVVSILGTFGDLGESLLKRTLGVKDSGSILPGHGGMLDRFDSSLIAIPAALAYLLCIGAIV